MKLVVPETESEISALIKTCVTEGKKMRAQGAGKSHPNILESSDISLSLEKFSTVIALNKEALTVTVGPGMMIDILCAYLWDEGFTVSGLGSVNGQTIGGILSTGAHSQGLEMRNFSSYVVGIRLIDGLGKTHTISKEENPEQLNASIISFGCLGIITQVRMEIIPRFYVGQTEEVFTYRKKSKKVLDSLIQHPILIRFRPEIGRAFSYSVPRYEEANKPAEAVRSYEGYFIDFQRFNTKFKIGRLKKLFLKMKRYRQRFIELFAPNNAKPQYKGLGYALPLKNALTALVKIDKYINSNYPKLTGRIGMRTAKSDGLWLSQSYGSDVCHVGCYLTSSYDISAFSKHIESILVDLNGRPHWGKDFTMEFQDFEKLYPRWNDFKALRLKMDANGVFSNQWTERIFRSQSI